MIDTHAHIDDPVYQEHLDEFIRAQQQAGVEAIIVPGVDETNIHAVRDVCARYPHYLYPAIGLHPENISANWQDQLAILHAHLSPLNCSEASSKLNYIAIGEIGLDYHFSTEFKSEQHEALRTQLRWAMELDLPALLHVRDATEDALTILREFPGLRGVMHCWSGSEEVARQIVDMGLYLGIGGIITFKNCKLREHLSSIPLERLVLETDAPYMAPVPHRGETNQSGWISYVIAELAKIYNLPAETIDSVTTANAHQLFRL